MCDCEKNSENNRELAQKLKEASRHFNMSPEELEMKIRNALQNLDHSEGMVVAAASSTGCVTYSDSITVISGVIVLKVKSTYCSGANWKITVEVKVVAFGETVGTLKFSLDSSSPKQCLSLNVAVAKADICLEVKGSCLYISGKACYYDVFSFKWRCESFSEKLFCF